MRPLTMPWQTLLAGFEAALQQADKRPTTLKASHQAVEAF